MALTDKQRAFAKHYCLTFSKTEAARLAGYPEAGAATQGWRNFRNPEIQDLIKKSMGKAVEKADLQLEDLLADTEEIKRRCMQGEQVMEEVDGAWQPTGEWKFDSRGALKAIELQGKFLKLLSDKQEVEHGGQISVTIRRVGFDAKKPKP